MINHPYPSAESGPQSHGSAPGLSLFLAFGKWNAWRERVNKPNSSCCSMKANRQEIFNRGIQAGSL